MFSVKTTTSNKMRQARTHQQREALIGVAQKGRQN